MPWTLEIHQIDVGQGESTLIVARDLDATGNVRNARSMLIDAGRKSYGQTVHSYLVNHLPMINARQSLDMIVVTHFDADHSGGVTALLAADNCRTVASRIAADAIEAHEIVTAQMTPNTSWSDRYELMAYVVCSMLLSGATRQNTEDFLNGSAPPLRSNYASALASAKIANQKVKGKVTSLVRAYIDFQKSLEGKPVFPTIPQRVTYARIAVDALLKVPTGTAPADVKRRVTDAVNCSLSAAMGTFQTNDIFKNSVVIDPGLQLNEKDVYKSALSGMAGSGGVRAARGSHWKYAKASLGSEVFWSEGGISGAASPVPLGAPAIFVLASNRQVWQTSGVVGTDTERENAMSIALVVRFNGFSFYTGGDLVADGEDKVLKAISTENLSIEVADANGATSNSRVFPIDHVCGFKCGHHGAETSTSEWFAENIHAATALISCGRPDPDKEDKYQHPRLEVILNLVRYISGSFYLTNVRDDVSYIQRSLGRNQLTEGWYEANDGTAVPNKAFVAGDNMIQNLTDGRHRGDIVIEVTQAESLAPRLPPVPVAGQAYHQFRLSYWDADAGGLGIRQVAFPH